MGGLLPGLLLGEMLGGGLGRGPAQPWPPAPQTSPTQPATLPVQTSVACWNCGRAVGGALTFCPHCGQRLDAPACHYCGQTLEPEARSCAHCGAPVTPTRSISTG